MRGARIVDIGLTIFFLVIAIVAIWQVQEFPFQDQLYPYTASGMILVFVLFHIGHRFFSAANQADADESDDGTNHPFTRRQMPTLLPLVAAVGLLILGVLILGHLIAVPGFAFLYMIWRGEKWWVGFIGAALLVLFIQGLLVTVMEVAMPRPWIADWLGI